MNFRPDNMPIGGSNTKPRLGWVRRLYCWRQKSFAMILIPVLLFAGIFATRYKSSMLRAKVATLKANLFVVCNAVRQFTLDNHAAPKSLDDLVRSKYLSAVPTNPITHQKLALQDCAGGPDDSMEPGGTR